MTPQPGGRLTRIDEGDALLLTRAFDAAPEDVWAAITEPARLARWIGTWTGDPAAGHVAFAMTAEGDDGSAPMRYEIERCDPPSRLTVASRTDFGNWRLALHVVPVTESITESVTESVTAARAAGRTELRFHHVIDDPAGLENIGPGWEYHLDRLVAAETGGDAAAITWDDYYPAQSGYYADLAGRTAGD